MDPVSGANCYEFELGTSKNFTENAIVWSNVRYGIKPGQRLQVRPGELGDGFFGNSVVDVRGGGHATVLGRRLEHDVRIEHDYNDGDPSVTSVIEPLRIPAVSVDVALPWFTGQPYALYAHVRAITKDGPTPWSNPFAFNMRWPSVPTPLPSQPGLVRWTPIQGATGYQVWFRDFG